MVRSVKNIKIGLLVLAFALLAGIFSQFYIKTNTFAANTLSGNNEVINLATTDGLPANATVGLSGVSGDGNVLLVSSNATNLPNAGFSAGTGNGLYTYNIRTNTTTRVDVSASGVLPNDHINGASISENGRYVYFLSYATNLIDGTTQYPTQTYIRDLQVGTIIAVSNHYWSGLSQDIDYPMGISNDGRFVQLASRFVGVGYPNFYNNMIGDRKSGTFVWTSLGQASDGSSIDLNSGGISCDSSFAVYIKSGVVYFADLRNGTPTVTSISGGSSSSPRISCNGNYTLYTTTNRTDVTPTPPGAGTYAHLVEYNRITGERRYIDTNSAGAFDSSHSTYGYSIANTGDALVKYNSYMYLKHISDGSGTLESVGKAADGTYINISGSTLLSSDGRHVFFGTDPYNLGLAPAPSTSQIIRTKTGL